MPTRFSINRRDFIKTGGAVGLGLALGNPSLWAQENSANGQPSKPPTNIKDVLNVPRTKYSIPGAYPGKVVEVNDPKSMADEKPVGEVVDKMFEKGITELTGKDLDESFKLFFEKDDVVGIKVNPIGPEFISTKTEVVDPIIKWLETGGIKRENIIIWDRFDYMLEESGFTPKRFPGIGIEGLQTIDMAAIEGKAENDAGWLDKDGNHISALNFDKDVYYWADVECPQDNNYLNQHVFNTKFSYFGNLITKKLTKFINVPVLKNTGNGISVALKNVGYGAICNTGRLHQPLFFDVCTEVTAFPDIRDKMVLNITDGLRAQYDGGPMPASNFAYLYNSLFFSTDPIAMDMTCHDIILAKRKSMGVKVNEHPRYTDYLRYGEKLGLGIADKTKIKHIKV
ncbi:MAG: DUF362 domain-containing protein [candidate division Zixibacteria bacterium]|nr:DUF362 domain-containing protein [candidate division Zixibacteria bacterium]